MINFDQLIIKEAERFCKCPDLSQTTSVGEMTLIRKEMIMLNHFHIEVPYVIFSIINMGLIAAQSSILLWNLFFKNGTVYRVLRDGFGGD